MPGPDRNVEERGARVLRLPGVHALMSWLVALGYAYLAIKGWDDATQPRGSDFTIYYRAGEAVLAGRDPMGVADWIYLPVCAVLIAPLAWLPYGLAAGVWQLGSLLAALWCVRRCVQLVERCTGSRRPLLRWLPALCVLRLVDSNLAYGQINLYVFAALLEGIYAWSRDRRLAAGAWLGLAAAIKLLPAFLFLLLLLRRRWSSLVVGVVTALALVLLAPLPALGWQTSWPSLATWWVEVAGPYRAGGDALLEARPYLAGQSLTAAAYRALTPIAASGGAEGPRANLVALAPDTVRWIVLGASALLVALFVVTVRARPSRVATRGWLVEVSLALCIALLLGPLVHKAHMVWVLLPITLLWSGLVPGRWRTFQAALFLIALFLIAITTPALLGREYATWMMERNALCYALLALVGALALERWCSAGPVPSRAPES